jgi:hypothetical protein
MRLDTSNSVRFSSGTKQDAEDLFSPQISHSGVKEQENSQVFVGEGEEIYNLKKIREMKKRYNKIRVKD